MLPGNYGNRVSGYPNWLGSHAARAVAAYVLDNAQHAVAPYLATTDFARRMPPTIVGNVKVPGGPKAWRGLTNEDLVYRSPAFMKALPKLPNRYHLHGGIKKRRFFRKKKYLRKK